MIEDVFTLSQQRSANNDVSALDLFSMVTPDDILNLPAVQMLQEDEAQAQVDAQQPSSFDNVFNNYEQPIMDDSMQQGGQTDVFASAMGGEYTPRSQRPAEPKGVRVVGKTSSKDLTGFVKEFEGWNPNSYADGRQRSIGYGTRAKKGERSISKSEAESRLSSELSSHRGRVESLNKKHGYNFTPAQIDALTSFDYNTGKLESLTGKGKRSKEIIAQKMLQYNKANLDGKGLKPLRGLTRRRKAEAELFTKGY